MATVRSAARTLSKLIALAYTWVATWEIPHYTRWGFYLQIGIVTFIFGYCKFFSLVPGYAVAFMALVAVIMTVRSDHFTIFERACWVLIASGLLFLEIDAIGKDRTESNLRAEKIQREQGEHFAAVREAQDKDFKLIIKGLENSITNSNSQFKQTITNLNTTLDRVNQTFAQTRPRADVQYERVTTEPENATLYQAVRYRFWFRNIGTDTAINIRKLGRAYLASSDEGQAQKDIMPQFEKDWIEREIIPPGRVVAVGDPERYDEYLFPGLQSADAAEFAAGRKRLYMLFRVQYEDKTGRRQSDHCDVSVEYVQGKGITQRHCSFFNETNEPVTSP